MRPVILAAATLLVTSSALLAATQNQPGERPWHLYAAKLDVTAAEFKTCFSRVSPDRNHAPSGATQRANKAQLLPCLQSANRSITNDQLDAVMDILRPEGPMR